MTHEPQDQPTAQTWPARSVLAQLRPQAYATNDPHKIVDPIVEPLWAGLRVLIAADEAGTDIIDPYGSEVVGMDEILAGLLEAMRADDLIVDGWITKQANRTAAGSTPWPDHMPSPTDLVFTRNNRAMDAVKLKETTVESITFDDGAPVAFVATDLLWLDGTPLLDIPLLERRRLLESVVVESDVVRVGAFVRPPIDAWVTSWRTQGFEGMTYKAANSRYFPSGDTNPEWVIAGMPRR